MEAYWQYINEYEQAIPRKWPTVPSEMQAAGRVDDQESLRELMRDGEEGYGTGNSSIPKAQNLEIPPIGDIPEIKGRPQSAEPIDWPGN